MTLGFAGYLVALAMLGLQQAEPQEDRVRALIREYLPHWEPERQAALARETLRRIPWNRWPPEDHERILGLLNYQLLGAMSAVNTNESMWNSTLRDGPKDVTSGLPTAPPEFKQRGEDLARSGLDILIEECLSAPQPSPETLTTVREQLKQVEAALRSAAERLVTGPYRDAVIRKTIDEGMRDENARLGNLLVNGLSRPLRPEQLRHVLGAIDDAARKIPILSAETDPELEGAFFLDEIDQAQGTKAALIHMYKLSYERGRWHDFCCPRWGAWEKEIGTLAKEVAHWRMEQTKELNRREAAHNGPILRKWAEERERRRAAHDAADVSKSSTRVTKVTRESPAPAEPRPASSPGSSSTVWRWIATVAVLLMAAAASYAIYRRGSREPSH